MIRDKSTRRTFIKTVGLAAGATAFGCGGGGPSTPPPPSPQPPSPQPPSPQPPPGGPVRVRADVSTLDPNGPVVQALRQGVAAMRQRAAGDPTSWEAQANIHLNFCPHNNWFFLPWHRGYLYYFEQVCRDASGDPDFNLPYWNWTAHPQVPAIFWQDPLNDTTRVVRPGDSASAEFVGPAVIDQIMGTSDFITFGSGVAQQQRQNVAAGILEGRPHNYIHRFVGGDMATFLSPLDPIFWLHHCNVDRLWAMWNEQHGNTNDAGWLNFEFAANFVDPQGNPVDVRVSDTLSTFQLGYRYDTQSAAESIAAPHAHVAAGSDAVEATSDGVASLVPLSVGLEPTDALRSRIDAVADAAPSEPRGTLRLEVGGVTPPDQAVGVRVFVNCANPSRTTSIDDPGYAGCFTFFEHTEGEGVAHHAEDRLFLFDVADTMHAIKQAGLYHEDADLDVQLVTVPLLPADHPESVALFAAEPQVSSKRISLSYVAPQE